MEILTGMEVGRRLVDSGVVPPETRRVILDIPATGVVTMYLEKNVDTSHFDIIQDIISGKTRIVEIAGVGPVESKPNNSAE